MLFCLMVTESSFSMFLRSMFDLNIAKYEGEVISVLGIIPYAMNDTKGKMSGLRNVQLSY